MKNRVLDISGLLPLLLCVCLFSFEMLAVPAKPGARKYRQPDGSEIFVTIKGDEFGQMIFSADGLLLTEHDGRLECACFGSDGIPMASGIAADDRELPGKVALTLQTKEQVDAWERKMAQNRQEIFERRRLSLCSSAPVSSQTENDNKEEDVTIAQNYGRFHTLFPSVGEQRALVILVEYSDLGFKYGSYDYFDRMLNEEGFSDMGSTGSVHDWLLENSGGKFDLHFDVFGPVTLPKSKKYYGADTFTGMDIHAYEMAVHAMQALDEEVDFSVYDGNEDGIIDNVFIIYAGPGDVGEDAVWPHQAFISDFKNTEYYFDGVKLMQYACACEHTYDAERQDGIGTFVHEFSHVLGLQDIYGKGPDGIFSFTPGEWSLLDSGVYNNDGITPPNYSCFERCALGWLGFRALKEGDNELPPLVESNVAYAIATDNENEFFFLENRQQWGNDEFLPGHGMLVWHIDFDEETWKSGYVNGKENHQKVDLVEADDTKTSATRAGDSFPGTEGVTEFGYNTAPRLAGWNGSQLNFDLSDITESDEGMISFQAIKPTADPGCADMTDPDPTCSGSDIYDMLGRRIRKPAAGRIYIRGSKKHVM